MIVKVPIIGKAAKIRIAKEGALENNQKYKVLRDHLLLKSRLSNLPSVVQEAQNR
jgi:hypothetical protein